jgi:hypothetical protein
MRRGRRSAEQTYQEGARTAFRGLDVVALRDIAAGEELTLDYATFCDESMTPSIASAVARLAAVASAVAQATPSRPVRASSYDNREFPCRELCGALPQVAFVVNC